MQARLATARLDGTRRLWRAVLAAFVSLALLTSLFNCYCCCTDCEDGTLTVSIAQTDPAESGKSPPCTAGALCCHCLAHIASVASQDNIATIEYVTRLDRLPAAPALDAADPNSLFKPPRA
jgi:hypothetical protein